MTDTIIEMTEDEFDQQYPLVTNHLNPNASWENGHSGGCLFDTFGDELAFDGERKPRARLAAHASVHARSLAPTRGRGACRVVRRSIAI